MVPEEDPQNTINQLNFLYFVVRSFEKAPRKAPGQARESIVGRNSVILGQP